MTIAVAMKLAVLDEIAFDGDGGWMTGNAIGAGSVGIVVIKVIKSGEAGAINALFKAAIKINGSGATIENAIIDPLTGEVNGSGVEVEGAINQDIADAISDAGETERLSAQIECAASIDPNGRNTDGCIQCDVGAIGNIDGIASYWQGVANP